MKGMECESGKVMKTKMEMETIIGRGKAKKIMVFVNEKRKLRPKGINNNDSRKFCGI